VFEEMFEKEMEERKNKRVEIKDVDNEVMSEMISFI
jgi:hypothetical protein